jgi:hypothetical protein
MPALRGVILTVRFLMELSLLVAVAFWGFHAGDGPTAWLLGLGAPVLVGVVWGAFVAPKAKRPVSVPVRLVIELVLFGLGASGLAVTGHATLAWVFAALAVATSLGNAATEGTTTTRASR